MCMICSPRLKVQLTHISILYACCSINIFSDNMEILEVQVWNFFPALAEGDILIYLDTKSLQIV